MHSPCEFWHCFPCQELEDRLREGGITTARVPRALKFVVVAVKIWGEYGTCPDLMGLNGEFDGV